VSGVVITIKAFVIGNFKAICIKFNGLQLTPFNVFVVQVTFDFYFVECLFNRLNLMGCKRDKVNNLITLSKLEQVDLK
jgi:hypothetical protein